MSKNEHSTDCLDATALSIPLWMTDLQKCKCTKK